MWISLGVVLATSLRGCSFVDPAQPEGCVRYDFSSLPSGHFWVNDSWPEPYMVSSPCASVATGGCKACESVTSNGASVIQLMGADAHGASADPKTWGCAGPRCIPCNSAGGTTAAVFNGTSGMSVFSLRLCLCGLASQRACSAVAWSDVGRRVAQLPSVVAPPDAAPAM